MKRSGYATLSEVARKAGVATTTVSRVINGGQNVDPRTLAKVQRAIDSLGYLPSQAARILKGARTHIIGLVVPSIADPFFSSCAEAIHAVARAHGSVLTVLATHNQTAAEREAVQMLIRHRVDGILLAPSNAEDDKLRQMLSRVTTPVVALDRPIAGSKVPFVVCNNYLGARTATEHLIQHGYKRITCLVRDAGLRTMQERTRGYGDAMKAARLPQSVELLDESFSTAEAAIRKFLQKTESPHALLTLKNSVTIDAYMTLQKLKAKVPAEVALMGYDDFPMAEILRPSISVIRQPVEQIGRTAAEMLFEKLNSARQNKSAPANGKVNVQLPTTLVVRGSCGCRRTSVSSSQRASQ